jgi:hypothetical protein
MSMKLCPQFEKPGANKVPGPGAYSSDYTATVNKEPTWRIGTSTRYDREKIMRRTCNFPPMNSYDPKYQATVRTLPKWGFGSSKRGELVEGKVVSPSMQTYSIPSKAVEGNKWCMGLKLANGAAIGADADKQKNTPGPGNYDPNFKVSVDQKPAYSMKGRYSATKRLNVPGPGTYNKSFVDQKSAPKYGFGSSPQRAPIKKTLSPGPGGYKIPSMIADVPTYSLPNRSD